MTCSREHFAVVRYHEGLHDVWNNVVKKSETGTLLHLREFCTHHAYKFDEASVIITRDDQPFAVLPGNVVTNKSGDLEFWSHSFLTYGGLVRISSSATTMIPALTAVRDYLIQEGYSKLVYKPVPWVFHQYPDESDTHALWTLGGYPIRRDLSSVSKLPLMESRIAHGRRSRARKAHRNGYTVQQTTDTEEFHTVLVRRLAARHNLIPAISQDDLDLLLNRFPENVRIFGCGVNGEIAAGALVFDCGNTIHFQYLTGTDEGYAQCAMDLLIPYVTNLYCDTAQYVSFGISTEGEQAALNPGLVDYKESWGTTAVTFDRWELPLFGSPIKPS